MPGGFKLEFSRHLVNKGMTWILQEAWVGIGYPLNTIGILDVMCRPDGAGPVFHQPMIIKAGSKRDGASRANVYKARHYGNA
jgi:hypothetical protein